MVILKMSRQTDSDFAFKRTTFYILAKVGCSIENIHLNVPVT